MRINSIGNSNHNIGYRARLDIVGDKTLLSNEQYGRLAKKALKLGNSTDLVLVGITRCANRDPHVCIKDSLYDSNNKETGSHTLLAGVCHTFFGVDNPPSFIQKVGDIYGSRSERAQKSFDIIDRYLDNLGENLKK